jgi:long-chain acyl-CoA synthetase
MTSTIAALAVDAEKRLADRIVCYVPQGTSFVPVTARAVAAARDEVAAALAKRGVKKGDRIGVVAETRLEWAILDLAILSLGAVTVGVYPTSTPAQMEHILAHAGCTAAFVAGSGPRAAVASIRGALPQLGLVVDIEGADERFVSLADLRAEGRAALAGGLDLRRYREEVRPDDVAAIVYTSGTTGNPKGVVLTHEALYVSARTGIAALGVQADDVGVGFLPLAHVLARVNFYGTLHAGNTIWFSKSLEEVAEVWRAARPTVLALVPRVLEKIQARILATVKEAPARRQKIFHRALTVGVERVRLLQESRRIPPLLAAEHALWERLVFRRVRAGLGWERLRFALSGGAPLRRDVAEFFHALGVLVLEGYGLSETSAASIVSLPSAHRIGSVGKPLPGVEMKLAGDGEILLKSPGLFCRYEGDEEATRAAFDEHGFFRTGDVGVIDAHGFVRLTDRKKDLLVTAGGKNVAPQNVEAALLADPSIVQAVVLGDGRPYLVALLAVDPAVSDPEAAAAAAVAKANATLARYEQVKRWALLDSELTVESGLLTPTQKVRRRQVLERYASIVDGLYDERRVDSAPRDAA